MIARARLWRASSRAGTDAYALALGAGTQAFTQGIGQAVLGKTELIFALTLGAGWVINLVVVEYVIRRRPRGPLKPRAGSPSEYTPGPAGAEAAMTTFRATTVVLPQTTAGFTGARGM